MCRHKKPQSDAGSHELPELTTAHCIARSGSLNALELLQLA